ncbi:hypothetical protein [Streptomyces sp. NPDC017095]|uniref:hypothetical protein n=1 Tax=Streptomyces sp. NPDC017095 TaxID=3364977 RepID=UPI0037B31395
MTSRTGGEDGGASGATRSFGFTALARGRTTVRLLHCPLDTCTGPDPGDRATPAGPVRQTTAPFPVRRGGDHRERMLKR